MPIQMARSFCQFSIQTFPTKVEIGRIEAVVRPPWGLCSYYIRAWQVGCVESSERTIAGTETLPPVRSEDSREGFTSDLTSPSSLRGKIAESGERSMEQSTLNSRTAVFTRSDEGDLEGKN